MTHAQAMAVLQGIGTTYNLRDGDASAVYVVKANVARYVDALERIRTEYAALAEAHSNCQCKPSEACSWCEITHLLEELERDGLIEPKETST